MTAYNPVSHQQCNGFTLIEVLVASVVLSVGLLGLAGLQMTSLKNTHSASMNSQASMLAYSMADQVRANPGGYHEDKTAWQAKLYSTLPSGMGSVTDKSVSCPIDNDADHNGYLIQIRWDKDQDNIPDEPPYEFCFYHEE